MNKRICAWVVQWQTSRMPAPAFWYYKSYDQAVKVAGHMVGFGNKVELRKAYAYNPHFMDGGL